MVNKRSIGYFGPDRRKVSRLSKMKSKSSIMKRSAKEANTTRQHYKDGRKDKHKTSEIFHIPSKKPINVRGPCPRKYVMTLSNSTTKTRALPRPSNDFSSSSKDKLSSTKEMGRSKGLFVKSRASSLPNNKSMLNEDPPSLAKNMKRHEASSLGLNNDVDAKSSRASLDCHSLNNVSSRLNNGAMSSVNNIKMHPCSSSQKNNMISSAKNTEKSRPSLPTGGLLFGKLANPPYVHSKDDSSSTSRVMNNSCSSMKVMTLCMPNNIVVKDNVILDNNQGKKLGARNDGSMVSKFLTNNEVSTSKDETMLDKNRYTRVDPSPLEEVMGSQVRQKDHSNALEANNFSRELDGRQIIQNEQHIFGINSSPFSVDLSSHRLIEESPKGLNPDDAITNDDGLKRDKRVISLVANSDTHEGNNKEVVSAKKRRKFIDNYEEDDGDRWNLSGGEGVRAGRTTSSTIVEDWCSQVSKSSISEPAKLQYYSLLPINEPIWSGLLRIGRCGFISMAAHLSPKSCKKVWEVSRSLQPVIKLTKLSRLAAFPKGSAVLKPSHDNIGLYFLPTKNSPNEDLDQLVKELIENDMVLRAVVEEAELLILHSVLLPEQHKTFKGKHYLWGVFRPRKDNIAVVEEHRYPCDEEMEDVSCQHVVEEVSKVASLNINCEIEAPEQVESQHIQKKPSSSLPEKMNAPSLAEAAACPASAPTMAATMSAIHVQSNSPSLEVPSGAVFVFVGEQTARFKELIQELQRNHALFFAMQGERIG